MCLICLDLDSGKMTLKEAMQNLSEIKEILSEKHAREVHMKIWDEFSRRNKIGKDYYNDHGNGD